MLTLEYVKEHINEIEKSILDPRFTKRLLNFIPTSEWENYGYKCNDTKEYTPKEWTEENVLEQLKADTEFAIKKATNHRGISAGLMNDVLRSWCIVLENGLENTNYGWYGDKLIKKVDELYDFGLVKEDTFDQNFYEAW